MRSDKKQNVDFVYSVMKSMYEQTRKWKEPLPFEAINKRAKSMNRRTLYRYLNTLLKEKPPRAFRTERGTYTIDYAKEQYEKERIALTQIILSVDDYRKIKGETRKVINGQKVDIPNSPIYRAPETANISRYIEKWRLQTHGHKDIAQAEASAWVNSFVESITYRAETGEADLKIRPEKLITTGRKTGVNAFIFRKAMEIMLELLESLDFERLKRDGDSYLQDAQLSVTINFNPAIFLQALKYFRDNAEVNLNSKRKRVTNKFGMVANRVELNETLEKRVFCEIFKDQPNDLVTETIPIRHKSHALPDGISEEFKYLMDILNLSYEDNKD